MTCRSKGALLSRYTHLAPRACGSTVGPLLSKAGVRFVASALLYRILTQGLIVGRLMLDLHSLGRSDYHRTSATDPNLASM
jgi:hypothetical protein